MPAINIADQVQIHGPLEENVEGFRAELGRLGFTPASVKKFGYALRAFLRFCYVTGELDHDLTAVTLVIHEPLPSLLPVGASPAEIEALLGACDRNTPLGRRSYVVLLLLARLVLRAGEVAGLQLQDINWHQGEVLVRGKGSKQERLPLLAEVGAAVADYLTTAQSTRTCVRCSAQCALPEVA